ncbi:RbsD/FucU domain-containing protein [Croceibacterium sp. TMG7-5b_MA50]|uniref:RbsD/FucU family protein n=1 Tax=Croceibacterium sp. TMG7-5b_MA50 TaxID=3121290 RepID=UPI003221573C
MLIGIDPLLGPELLAVLRAMGHGDEIAIVDANFPAAATARRLIRADGLPLTRMLGAILGVLPLDRSDEAAFTMQVIGDATAVPDAVADICRLVAAAGDTRPVGTLERHAFYARAAGCFAIVATGETRLYGNVILRKGVVEAPGLSDGDDA